MFDAITRKLLSIAPLSDETENIHMLQRYKHYVGICSGLLLLIPMVAYGERLVSLDQINLTISTDKRVYYAGDIAVYVVAFRDSSGKLVDPDLIRATYDSQFIDLERVGVGLYRHTTDRLTLKDHQLGVYAEKVGLNYVQQSLTVSPIITQNRDDHVKATAVQQGDLLKLRIGNDVLSKKDIYKVRVITIGANIESIASSSWIKVPNHIGIDLKSVNGSISPDEKQTIKLYVNGDARMIVWNAYDVHGKQIYAGTTNVYS